MVLCRHGLGYAGRTVDLVVQRVVDSMMAVPA